LHCASCILNYKRLQKCNDITEHRTTSNNEVHNTDEIIYNTSTNVTSTLQDF